MTTLGTYNTLDGKGTVTDFGDILLLTEAIPAQGSCTSSRDTHDVYVCRFQRDLVIAIRKTLRARSTSGSTTASSTLASRRSRRTVARTG